MNNKLRPSNGSEDPIEFLNSSVIQPKGLPSDDQTGTKVDGTAPRRVTVDEVPSPRRGRSRSPSRKAYSIRSRSGSIAGRGGREPIDPDARPSPDHRRRHRGLRIALITVFALLAIVVIGVYIFWRSLMSNVEIIPTNKETVPSEYNIPTESLQNPVPQEKGIQNILLLGVDSREEGNLKTNSDTMMILTVDEINKKIKLTSLQRDMLVYEPGKEDPVKLNAVNTHGGPMLTVRVVNETFRLNIRHYVMVNMSGMEAIINIAGGVTVTVEKDEISHINGEVDYQNSIFADTPQSPHLTKAGEQTLDGRQAVAFARIRKLDSDYARMGRQRIVIQALLDQFMKANVPMKTNMVSNGLKYITTNMSKTQLTGLGLSTVPLMNQTIEQLQIPIKGFFKEYDSYKGSTWVNLSDFNGMIPLLHEFIFGTSYPFDPVKKIPGAPNSGTTLATKPPTTTAKPTTTARPTTTAAPTTAATTAATTTVVTTTATTSEGTTATSAETSVTTSTTNPSETIDPTTKNSNKPSTITVATTTTTTPATTTAAAATTTVTTP